MASRVLALEDLGPLVRGGKTAPAKAAILLPETPLHTERLRHTNAEVDYSAAKVQSRDFPLTSLDTHISVEGGVLNLKPLAFGFTQGKLAGSIRIDARKDIPDLDRGCALHRHPCREFHQGQRQADQRHAGSARGADRHRQVGA